MCVYEGVLSVMKKKTTSMLLEDCAHHPLQPGRAATGHRWHLNLC